MALQIAIPEIHVSVSAPAREFYCGKLGFTCVSAWRPSENKDDPCYMLLTRDSARLHVSSFRDAPIGATVFIYVDDVEALHAEFAGNGVEPLGPIFDQTWNVREFSVRDPDNNNLRFGQKTRA